MDNTRTSRPRNDADCHRFSAVEEPMFIGTSFKPEHLQSIQNNGLAQGFFEIHAENFMTAGGPAHWALEALRCDYPISIHGVNMSIGGTAALDKEHLTRFRQLVSRYEPALVSEHLAWSSHDGRHFNDLLPLPYTNRTLSQVCSHITEVQDAIQRPLLLENPATYVTFNASTYCETDFIKEIARRTGCGLLLDLNNVYVCAMNHGFSPESYLWHFPLEHVREIHLAGHSRLQDGVFIDSHQCEVATPIWQLYSDIIALTKPTPTLIEWDSHLPAWPILKAEAERARQFMCHHWGFPAEVAL